MLQSDNQARSLEHYVARGDFANFYGSQWGDTKDPVWMARVGTAIKEGFIDPFVSKAKTIMEIGSGGGRWSQFLWSKYKRCILVDGTQASQAAICGHFDPPKKTEFLVAPTGAMPTVADGSVDFVFSFDVFVHFEAPLFNAYIAEIGRVLTPGGVLCLHYTWDAGNTKPYFYPYDSDALKAKLATVGLEVFGELKLRENTMIKARKTQ